MYVYIHKHILFAPNTLGEGVVPRKSHFHLFHDGRWLSRRSAPTICGLIGATMKNSVQMFVPIIHNMALIIEVT